MNDIIANAIRENRNLLEHEAYQLLAAYGIPTPAYRLVNDLSQAIAAANQIGYPVTLKVVSADILHKSEAGGVINQIGSDAELQTAFLFMSQSLEDKAKSARIEGFLITAFASAGLECIAGMTKDNQFGHALLFGLGGIFVEVLEDVSIELLPLTKAEARGMISSIKGARLLNGYRGQDACDIDAIVELLLNLAKLSEEHPEISEIDLNPFFVYKSGCVVVDARILFI